MFVNKRSEKEKEEEEEEEVEKERKNHVQMGKSGPHRTFPQT